MYDTIDIPRFPPPGPEPVYHCAECGELIPEDDLPEPMEMPLVARCRECGDIYGGEDEEEMTIGQLVDALREKCMEELGVEAHVRLDVFDTEDHDTAERLAIRMSNELGGEMSGIEEPLVGDSPTRWYRVEKEGIKVVMFWYEKEKLPVQAAVVNG